MPTYVYHCKECDSTFEIVRSIHDAPLRTHAGCGGLTEQVFMPPSVNLKQGQENVVVERNKDGIVMAKTTQHWDGRQDVTVRPSVVNVSVGNDQS